MNILQIIIICGLLLGGFSKAHAYVTSAEAVKMAKGKAAQSDFRSYFSGIKPKIRTDKYAQKFPQYYFVDFTPKIYTEFMSYLVVIEKKTGKIVHARDYYWPNKQPNLEWIFN